MSRALSAAASEAHSFAQPEAPEAHEPAGREHVARQPLKYLTQIQICRRIGVSVQTWRNWRQRGEVPEPSPLPGRPRWLLQDIERFEAQGRIVHTGRKTFFGTAVRRRA